MAQRTRRTAQRPLPAGRLTAGRALIFGAALSLAGFIELWLGVNRLTGLIGALLAQGLEPFEAAQVGVYVHGLAGDLARDERGEVSLIASDLLDFLPYAFRNL